MRLWSLHPRYLDATGLVALWRETLLAQAVLHSETRGYRHHPQLRRFQQCADPRQAIAAYLWPVHAEATRRGYRFDVTKIRGPETAPPLGVSDGQIAYEWQHLLAKLDVRAPDWLAQLDQRLPPQAHPMFDVAPGDIAPWEVITVGKPSPKRRA